MSRTIRVMFAVALVVALAVPSVAAAGGQGKSGDHAAKKAEQQARKASREAERATDKEERKGGQG